MVVVSGLATAGVLDRGNNLCKSLAFSASCDSAEGSVDASSTGPVEAVCLSAGPVEAVCSSAGPVKAVCSSAGLATAGLVKAVSSSAGLVKAVCS